MRVLYVSHTPQMSGAERSLLVLLQALRGHVSPVVACPEGELAGAVRELGIEVRPIPGTELSSRLHPHHTIAQTVRAARAAGAVRAIASQTRAELVHATTPRGGLISMLARGAGGAGPVIHVRDSIPPGRLPRALFALLAARAAAFVPTAEFLRRQLPAGTPAPVVPNVIEPAGFDAAADRAAARARLGLDARAPVLTLVGQISPHKAQRDAIETLALVRRAHPDAQLLIVGSVKFAGPATRYDNCAYERSLVELAESLGLTGAVHFLGERSDIAQLLAATDLLLVPSWYEPFGRVALEAMLMRVPVLATSVGGITEVIDDGVDGLLLDPRDPPAWAAAATELLSDPRRRARMGAAGREKAVRDYSPERHVTEIMAVYRRAMAGAR